MSYRSLHSADDRVKLTAFWLLAGLFVLAVGFMFVHPSVTLALFWVGLIVVGATAFAGRMVRKAERHAAMSDLERRICPSCGAPFDWEPAEAGSRHCGACGAGFSAIGDEISALGARPS